MLLFKLLLPKYNHLEKIKIYICSQLKYPLILKGKKIEMSVRVKILKSIKNSIDENIIKDDLMHQNKYFLINYIKSIGAEQ